jgi:hypothetical protein
VAASNAHIAGDVVGAVGALPAKGSVSELARFDIAEVITATGSCGTTALGTAGGGAAVGPLKAEAVTAADGTVAADAATAFETMRQASTEVINVAVSWRASGGATVPAESVVVGDTDPGRVAVVEEAEGLDLLPCSGGFGLCEVALSEVGTVSVKSVGGVAACAVEDCGLPRLGVSLNPLDVGSEPVCAPSLPTTTPGPVAVPDDEAVPDEESDGAVVAPAWVADADAV